MVSKSGLYAYGLVGKRPTQLNILGIDQKSKIYAVGGGGVCVMVSKIDTNKFQNEIKKLLSKLVKTSSAVPGETEEILRRHEDVVEALMRLTAVVPFKFGTILKDDQAALKMLQDYKEKFKKLLSKFSGKEEWGLKVYADKKQVKKHLGETSLGLKAAQAKREKLSRGTAYLLGRKTEEELNDASASWLAKVCEVIFQKGEKHAYEAKLNKTLPSKMTGKKTEMILNPVYLIERGKVAHFCKQVEKLTGKYKPMGLEVEISGPWPPYNFT